MPMRLRSRHPPPLSPSLRGQSQHTIPDMACAPSLRKDWPAIFLYIVDGPRRGQEPLPDLLQDGCAQVLLKVQVGPPQRLRQLAQRHWSRRPKFHIGVVPNPRMIAHDETHGFVGVPFGSHQHHHNHLLGLRIGICEDEEQMRLADRPTGQDKSSAGAKNFHPLPRDVLDQRLRLQRVLDLLRLFVIEPLRPQNIGY